MKKTIKMIKKGDEFISQNEECYFIKKKATEDGFCITIRNTNVSIFVSHKEFDKAFKKREKESK